MLLLAGGCQRKTPFKPVASIEQIMETIVHPSATVVFQSVGTVFTMQGVEEIAPKTAAEWTVVQNNSLALAEAGNLLMMEGRAVDREGWMLAARGLVDKAERAMKAAEAKDTDALFTANSDVFIACTDCHKTYALAAEKGSKGAVTN